MAPRPEPEISDSDGELSPLSSVAVEPIIPQKWLDSTSSTRPAFGQKFCFPEVFFCLTCKFYKNNVGTLLYKKSIWKKSPIENFTVTKITYWQGKNKMSPCQGTDG
jgi:hypothetical protein